MRPHRWQPTRLQGPWDSPGKNTGVGCHFLLQCMKVKSEVVQSLSRVRLFATPWTATHQAPPSMGFSRQEYWSGVPSSSPESLDGSFAIQWLTSILYTSFSLGSIYRSVRKPYIYFQVSNGCQSSFPQRLPEFITGVLGKDRNPNWQLLAHLLHPSKFQWNIESILWLWLQIENDIWNSSFLTHWPSPSLNS